MAQNITIAGIQYPDVPAIQVPKAGSGTATFTDVSDTTATAADVSAGTYFYTAAGVRTEGTGSGSGGGHLATITTSNAWTGWVATRWSSGYEATAETVGYYCTPSLSGYTVTPNSKIDLQPTEGQLMTLRSRGVRSIFVRNDNGTLRFYTVGESAGAAVTFQCTVSEVET